MAYLSTQQTDQLSPLQDQQAAIRRRLQQQGQNIAGEDPGNSSDPTPTPPVPSADFTPSPGFTNTSTVKPSTPSGTPDPKNPGYDTSGFRLGSKVDAQGNLTIPNTATGQIATTPAGTLNTTFSPLPAPPPPPPGPTVAPQPVNGYAIPAQPNPFVDQLRQLILSRLKEAVTPVDPNAPQIVNTVNAARNDAQRASARERTQLAERLYAQGQGGLGSDALTRQIQQSGEKNAASISSLRANLIQQVYTQKAAELQNLLQLAIASGDSESARSVQLQLAALQAAVQRESIGANLAISGQNFNNSAVANAGG